MADDAVKPALFPFVGLERDIAWIAIKASHRVKDEIRLGEPSHLGHPLGLEPPDGLHQRLLHRCAGNILIPMIVQAALIHGSDERYPTRSHFVCLFRVECHLEGVGVEDEGLLFGAGEFLNIILQSCDTIALGKVVEGKRRKRSCVARMSEHLDSDGENALLVLGALLSPIIGD